jgi:hypothetical protein
MPNLNLLYNTTSGRILSANLNAQAPIPAGHAIVVKNLENFTEVWSKRIDPSTLAFIDKDYLKITSATTVPISTVTTSVFTKQDGETDELKDDVADNESVLISSRETNGSFNANLRRSFFDVLTTSLVNGAGQVKIATGLAPGKETIVVFNDTLRPVFQTYTYV